MSELKEVITKQLQKAPDIIAVTAGHLLKLRSVQEVLSQNKDKVRHIFP